MLVIAWLLVCRVVVSGFYVASVMWARASYHIRTAHIHYSWRAVLHLNIHVLEANGIIIDNSSALWPYFCWLSAGLSVVFCSGVWSAVISSSVRQWPSRKSALHSNGSEVRPHVFDPWKWSDSIYLSASLHPGWMKTILRYWKRYWS